MGAFVSQPWFWTQAASVCSPLQWGETTLGEVDSASAQRLPVRGKAVHGDQPAGETGLGPTETGLLQEQGR